MATKAKLIPIVEVPELVRAVEAARLTGIPYCSLRDLSFRGHLPRVRLGRAWFFKRSDLRLLIEASTEQS